jgi:glycosyltransferase involved in cell wall biosynthesis
VVRVSVVVPVYNPGRYIEPLIDSLAAQTLPQAEFETIFVDDGSTDDTPARLDELARERANVRVIHQENSGWPGRPRNVGVDAAGGDYVYFADNDDWFSREALERMHATAVRVGADIVIGKIIGHERGVPRELFRRNLDRATVWDAPLVDSLTPHKLFRRAFLQAHGLRFPEGRRRLEDLVVVMRAYLLAQDRVAVVADYPCYHHLRLPDSSNASYADIDPASYYGYLRETLDVVEEHVEEGPRRDALLHRFLRTDLLSRLEWARLLDLEPGYRRTLFDETRRLMEERFPTTVDERLHARQRLLARLVRAGDLDGTLRYAEWGARVAVELRLDEVRWCAEELLLRWQARLVHPDDPLLRRDGPRLALAPPGLPAEPVDLPAERARGSVDVVARLRDVGDFALLPTSADVTVDADGAVVVTGEGRFSAHAAAHGSPLARGVWDFWVGAQLLGWMQSFGWPRDARLGATRRDSVDQMLRPAAVDEPARIALPYWTQPHGNLSLDVDGAVKPLARTLAPSDAGTSRGTRSRDSLRLPVPVVSAARRSAGLELRHRDRGGPVALAAYLEPAGDQAVVVAADSRLRRRRGLRAGWYDVQLRLLASDVTAPLGWQLAVSLWRRPTVHPAGATTALSRVVDRARGVRRRARRAVRQLRRQP